jgi:DNA repair exonuclease SbcCD ATPase subunit
MTPPSERKPTTSPRASTYATRTEALKTRVAEAANVLQEQGIRPTVTRIRAALNGGSPNDIAPALKQWRDSILASHIRTAPDSASKKTPPPQITDLIHELWQRATAAALIEIKGGATARQIAARTEEAQSLRNQLTTLRDQLQRESLAYGELRAQAARYEAMAREALARERASETRERNLLRDLGTAQQKIAELEATAHQKTTPPNKRHHASSTRHITRRRPKSKRASAASKTPTTPQKRGRRPLRVTAPVKKARPRQKPIKSSSPPRRTKRRALPTS